MTKEEIAHLNNTIETLKTDIKSVRKMLWKSLFLLQFENVRTCANVLKHLKISLRVRTYELTLDTNADK